MTNDSEHTKENVIKDNVLRYILVFTPYHPYYHVAYYSYAPEKYGTLSFGTVVRTTMGVGIVVKEDISKDTSAPGRGNIRPGRREADKENQ